MRNMKGITGLVPAARNMITALQPGEILLLDNVRYVSEEQTLFELKLNLSHEEQAKTLLVTKLAPLADLYVCDAFAAAHRDQPSLCGFEQVLPSAMGRLFEKEYCVISELMESPEKPCIFVLGGSKISDAFLMMETVLGSGVADLVLAGGLVGNILLAAKGEPIGSSFLWTWPMWRNPRAESATSVLCPTVSVHWTSEARPRRSLNLPSCMQRRSLSTDRWAFLKKPKPNLAQKPSLRRWLRPPAIRSSAAATV